MSGLRGVLERLKGEDPSDVRKIAEKSGVPYATLRKLRAESTVNPRLDTIEGLLDYYRRVDRARRPTEAAQ